ncbi:MAG TPA: hypothetical protein VNW92_04840 [Polyangiaceae bacterium]|nr:hypothetical protein [Polyangiaceae bacterium]
MSAALVDSAGCMQAAAPQACAAPPFDGAAELGLRELHEFGKNYEVFEVVVKLDGCIFYRTDDTSVLGRTQIDVAPKPVAPGAHDLELFTRFRSGPSADMHDYEWYEVQHIHLTLAETGTRTFVVRRSEVMHRDPRKRMQTDMSLE